MEPTRLFLCFTLAAVSAKSIVEKYVTVGDSVEFSASVNCTDDKEFKLMTEDISVTVAARVNGVWIPGKDYKDRTEHLSPSSLKLTGVTLTDNTLKGMYEFMCEGRTVTLIHLKVVAPSDRTETEGEINQNQTSLRPPPVNSSQGPVEDKGKRTWTIVLGCIAGVVLLLAAAAAAVILVRLYPKSPRSKVPPDPVMGEGQMEMGLLSEGVSTGPQGNGGPPVPNSNGC